jgi:hypothetical protein
MCSGFFSSSIRHNREHLPPLRSPYDEEFVRQLEPFIPHLRDARFLGGEPFLIGIYYRIWEMILRLNPSMDVAITTNATILNDRIKSVLERMPSHIVASVDSLDRDSYERIRVNADYDRMRANLEYFIGYAERMNTEMALAVCPMRYNWREIPAIVRFCNDRGLRVYFNTVINPGDATFMYMCRDELQEVVSELGAADVDGGRGIPDYNRTQFRDLVNQIAGYAEAKSAPRNRSPHIRDAGSWTLEVQPGNRAFLTVNPESGRSMRVTFEVLVPGEAWNVRLVTTGVTLSSGRCYVAAFQARSDEPRQISFGANGPPPQRLAIGPYVDFWISSDWQRFEVEFVAEAGDEAELFLNLGNSRVPVEFADVTFCDVADAPQGSGR